MTPFGFRLAAMEQGRDDARAEMHRRSTACVDCGRERATHADGRGDYCHAVARGRVQPEAVGALVPAEMSIETLGIEEQPCR